MDSNIRREIILDHYENPINKSLTNEKGYILENTNSESCIDNIDIQMKIVNNKIIDIRFDGEACAISTAATSMTINNLIGKSVSDAKKILLEYEKMIKELPFDKELIGELIVYDEIYKQPNRVNCALLPKVTIDKILKKLEKMQIESK